MAYERTQADQRMRSGKDQHSPVETFPHPSDEGKSRDKAGERMHVSCQTDAASAALLKGALATLLHQVPRLNETGIGNVQAYWPVSLSMPLRAGPKRRLSCSK